VSGGDYNTAGGDESTVGGGLSNTASGNTATVAGGAANNASGDSAMVGGGDNNLAGGDNSTVGGGGFNVASGYASTVAGGGINYAPPTAARRVNPLLIEIFGSTASGDYSSIGGGTINTAAGYASTVAGGDNNLAGGDNSTVGGGINNTATNTSAVVSGGTNNVSGGYASTVAGGSDNAALGDYSFAAGNNAQAINNNSFVWSDGSTNTLSMTNNQFMARAMNGFVFLTSTDATTGVSLAPGATSWATLSDRNAKKDFAPVNTEAILAKLSAVPVEQWRYKWEADDSTPNIGPMAQDFIRAFYPGRNDKSITTLEFDGVELAAIQGLNQKLNQKEAEIQDLKQRVEKLEQLLNQKNGGGK
jgi:hypothetical protein